MFDLRRSVNAMCMTIGVTVLVVTAGARVGRAAPLHVVVTGDRAPQWCRDVSVDPIRQAGDWRRTLAEFWIREFLYYSSDDTNASTSLLRRIGKAVRKDSIPVFVVSDPHVVPKQLGLSTRVKSVKSFDNLRGDRWEIGLRFEGIRGKSTADAQMLVFSWNRIQQHGASEGLTDFNVPIEEQGTQEYCALRSGTDIRVSLIGSSSH